jgi:hypothetical protein
MDDPSFLHTDTLAKTATFFYLSQEEMERSDTIPDMLVVPKEELPKREEVSGDSPTDRMMQMCLSLRAELYDLYAKHQALLDENKRLSIKLKENAGKSNAICDSASRCEEPVLGGDKGDGTSTLVLPVVEDAGKEAAESLVSPCTGIEPNSPKFPLCPCDFPVSPSEHGLATD